MEIKQLEHFVAVAELGSFTRAGERLHVVQSGVSATIQRLERELGTPLFERGAGGVRLTLAGSRLLPLAHTTINAARKAKESVMHLAGGVAGSVNFGTLPSIDAIDLPGLLARLGSYPAIRVRLITSPRGSGGLCDDLLDGELDVALVANDGSSVRGVRLTWLLTAPIVALVPTGHPVAERASVRLDEIAHEHFIDFPPGFGSRQIVDDAFDRLGSERLSNLEVTTITDAASYVRMGLGLSLVPQVHSTPTGTRTIPVRDPEIAWVLSLATPSARAPSAAAQAVIDLVPAFLQRQRR